MENSKIWMEKGLIMPLGKSKYRAGQGQSNGKKEVRQHEL